MTTALPIKKPYTLAIIFTSSVFLINSPTHAEQPATGSLASSVKTPYPAPLTTTPLTPEPLNIDLPTPSLNTTTNSSSNPNPTLYQLQQATIANNPELKAKYASNQTAQSNIDIAKTGWLPAVTANANKTYGRGNDAFVGTTVPIRKTNETGKVGFNITQNLYDPTINIGIDQAKLSAKSSEYAISQSYDDLTNRTVALFFDILATQAQINLLDAQQIAVDEQKKQAQKSFEVGTVSITDVKEAEAKYDKIAAQKASLSWQLQSKQAELSTLTGGLTINPASYKSSTKILPDLNKNDLATWQNALIQQNTTVQQAQTDYQIAQLDTKKQRYQNYPKAQFVIDNNRNFEPFTDKGHEGYLNNKWEWSAGVQISMNLFNSSANSAQLRKALSEENLKYQNLQVAKEQQGVELQRTFYQILGSIAEYQGQHTAVQSAQTALSANMLGYQVGMRINADVLEAQSKVYEANKDRLVAWYDSWKNYIKLNQIAGTLNAEQLQQIDNLLRQPVADTRATDPPAPTYPLPTSTISTTKPKKPHRPHPHRKAKSVSPSVSPSDPTPPSVPRLWIMSK